VTQAKPDWKVLVCLISAISLGSRSRSSRTGRSCICPAGWEALPPVPANGPEILRATGGPGRNLIVFKVPARGAVVHRTREYFAVRGNAAFVLGMGSTTWEEHLPLIEQIVGRFELTE